MSPLAEMTPQLLPCSSEHGKKGKTILLFQTCAGLGRGSSLLVITNRSETQSNVPPAPVRGTHAAAGPRSPVPGGCGLTGAGCVDACIREKKKNSTFEGFIFAYWLPACFWGG